MANFEKIGEMSYDNLVNAADLPMPVERSAFDKSDEVIRRGTVLKKGTKGLTPMTATSDEPFAIAAADIPAGEEAGEIYLAGHFNRDRVNEITGITLSDENVNALRKLGIVLSWARK